MHKKMLSLQYTINDLTSKLIIDPLSRITKIDTNNIYFSIEKSYKFKSKLWVFVTGTSIEHPKTIIGDCLEYKHLICLL